MKFAAIAWIVCVVCLAADPKKPAPRPAAKAEATKKSPAVTIPAGAVKVDETTYRFTDTAGKTWIYQKTPFGVTKTEQGDVAAASAAAASAPQKPADSTPFGKLTSNTPAAGTKAVEDGDSIKFERPTPFGVQKWTRKKSELNEDERAIWEKQRTK